MNEDHREALKPKLAMDVYSELKERRPHGASLGELSAELKADPARLHYRLTQLVDVGLVDTGWRGATLIYKAVNGDA